jgi:hypothetical protein
MITQPAQGLGLCAVHVEAAKFVQFYESRRDRFHSLAIAAVAEEGDSMPTAS